MHEWSTLRKMMLARGATGAPLNEYTVTGNPVTFNTNKAKPLTKMLVQFSPYQEGTGDPSPSNVRSIFGTIGLTVWHTGKNLLNVAEFVDNKVWWQGSLAQGYTGYKASYKIPVVPNAKYTLYKSKTGQNQLQYFDADGQYISQNAGVLGYEVSKFTIPDGVYFIGINLDKDSLATAQLEVGETSTAYEAFTGTTYAVEFPALGNNLFNKDDPTVQAGVWWKGNIVTGGSYDNYTASAKIPVIPGETYTLIRNSTGQGAVCFFDAEGVYSSQVTDWNNIHPTWTIPSGVYFIAFNVVTEDIGSAMLNVGSTALPYEPYTSTCYGGSLDLTTGVLTAEWKCVDMGTLDYTLRSAYGEHIFSAPAPNKKFGNFNLLSSEYKIEDAAIGNLSNNCIRGYSSNENVWLRNDSYSTASDIKDGMTGVQLAYELATPQVFQLTATQITAILGNNVIWSDTNQNCEVKYLKKG